MRVRPFLLTSMLVVAVLLVAGVVLDVAAPEHAKPASCAKADGARHAGLLQQAEKGYRTILGKTPDSACADAGLRLVIRARCAHATRIAAVGGAGKEARRAYVAILRADVPWWPAGASSPGSADCALRGLEAMDDPGASTP